MPKTRSPKAGLPCLALLLPLTMAACAATSPQPPRWPAPPPAVSTLPVTDAVEPPKSTGMNVDRQAPIALLLPLSGSFSATGEAVRDGFLAAHYDADARNEIRIYDVGSRDDLLRTAYQRALDEGAGLLVGPLRKESVALLASWNPPVPVIGLNFLDAGAPVPFNFLQMGLSPEDEAQAAAVHALGENRRRAVALVPETDWGERAFRAFEDRFRQGGGQVVQAARYQPGQADQSRLIGGLMGGGASVERHRALTAILGVKTVFETRRRGDVDTIFMVARAQDARLLAPQFRFHRSGELPIYATALVNDERYDADRAGIRFCDAPWSVGDALLWAAPRQRVAGLASATALPRLHALGRDAQRLAQGIARHELQVGAVLDGASGRLGWRDDGRIEREPECVQLRADGVRPLAPP